MSGCCCEVDDVGRQQAGQSADSWKAASGRQNNWWSRLDLG